MRLLSMSSRQPGTAGWSPAMVRRTGRATPAPPGVTLRRGRSSQLYTVTEPAPSEAVPVLRRYMAQIRVTRPYFDAAPDSPDAAIKTELPRHPVYFRWGRRRPAEEQPVRLEQPSVPGTGGWRDKAEASTSPAIMMAALVQVIRHAWL